MRYLIVILAIGFTYCSNSYATSYAFIAEVKRVGSILTRDNGDYIFLNGFDAAGSCPANDDGVVIRIPSGDIGNRAYSTALAAKMAGVQLRVAVDDTNKNGNGYCLATSVEIRN